MVTFKFDLDGDAPEEIATYMVSSACNSLQCLSSLVIVIAWFNFFKTVCLQVENGFILLLEKEIFIDQLKDIVDKAEDVLNEETEGERASTLSCSPQQGQICEGLGGEVRGDTFKSHRPHMLICRLRHGQTHGHVYKQINRAYSVSSVHFFTESAAWSTSGRLSAER